MGPISSCSLGGSSPVFSCHNCIRKWWSLSATPISRVFLIDKHNHVHPDRAGMMEQRGAVDPAWASLSFTVLICPIQPMNSCCCSISLRQRSSEIGYNPRTTSNAMKELRLEYSRHVHRGGSEQNAIGRSRSNQQILHERLANLCFSLEKYYSHVGILQNGH